MLRGGATQRGVGPRELDFPYYDLANGFQSTLLLVSDSPRAMDFTLAVRSSQGLMLTTAKTIQPQEKLSIDLATLITELGGDPNGAFAEGSVAVYFLGTMMPIVGQISIRNPQLGLAHESEMVENDPGRSDVPAVLNGAWWGLGSGVSAKVMVSNTSDQPQFANVYLDFGGKRHTVNSPLLFKPYETKVLDITQLVGGLGVDPAGAPSGGITIAQIGPHPALIANGKITDPATGFSSTIDFPLPQNEHASALHATGLPIGTPTKDSPFAGTGTFIPHVVVRNLLSTPQTVTISVEYPIAGAPSVSNVANQTAATPPLQGAPLEGATTGRVIPRPPTPGDKDHHPEWGAGTGSTTGSAVVASFSVAGYSTDDVPLSMAMNSLPLPLPFCSIRIQYTAAPGSLEAEVSSVETVSHMVVDARVENEGNGWAGSGANPWHIDKNTESTLFLTNESGNAARIGFVLTANGIHYYLTMLELQPHETRSINIRQLRDAQLADFRKNKVPANTTDGSVNWVRLDNVPVMGRLMVIRRGQGIDSSYDCCTTNCTASFTDVFIDPSAVSVVGGASMQCSGYGDYYDCNNVDYPSNLTNSGTWGSDNTSVMTVSSGLVRGQAGGTAHLLFQSTGNVYDCTNNCMETKGVQQNTSAPTTVMVQVQISSVSISPSIIHEQGAPQQANVYVQVAYESLSASAQGQSVTVSVGTYSTSPATGVSVVYSLSPQTLTIAPGSAQGAETKTFTVGGASIGGNSSATVIIFGSLTNPSAGVTIAAPSPVSNGRTTLTVDNP